MTFTIRIRGAHSQPIMRDFACHSCGPFSAEVDRDAETHPCPDCGAPTPFVWTTAIGTVRIAEVVRGGVAAQERPTWLSTRELAEGMPKEEWRAKRAKADEERRHAEAKEFSGFCKGVT